jgi:hypothetical protein
LHNRCGQLLEPLTALICPDQMDTLRERKKSSGGSSGGGARINLVNLMVMEDILQNGSEYGSQSQDCWRYVMRCVTFVLSIGGGRGGGTNESKGGKKRNKSKNPDTKTRKKKPEDDDDLDLNFRSCSPSESEPL